MPGLDGGEGEAFAKFGGESLGELFEQAFGRELRIGNGE